MPSLAWGAINVNNAPITARKPDELHGFVPNRATVAMRSI